MFKRKPRLQLLRDDGTIGAEVPVEIISHSSHGITVRFRRKAKGGLWLEAFESWYAAARVSNTMRSRMDSQDYKRDFAIRNGKARTKYIGAFPSGRVTSRYLSKRKAQYIISFDKAEVLPDE